MSISKYQELITTQYLHNYWPHYTPVAYAIYNDIEVLLANHPKCASKDYITISKTDAFNACTLILFEDIPTAIVDERIFTKFEEAYAVLVHELFHGYQYTYGESRFPNELVGIDYSLCVENIALRIEEHEALYNALQTKDLTDVNYFLNLRKTRSARFPQETGYEAAIETVEGPAHYVETKAFKVVAPNQYDYYIEKHLSLLTNPLESNLHIRKSCYSSGLALCLLLDYYQPDWHHAFTQSKLSIFEFFEASFQHNHTIITTPNHKQLAKTIIQKDQQLRQTTFQQFEQSNGYKIVIKGRFKITTFDPMNITKLNNQALHHHFVQFTLDDKVYTFTHPVLTSFEQNFMNIIQAELFSKTPPQVTGDSILIENTKLPGQSVEKVDCVYYLTIV